ncbi:MAG: hypothetical protein AMXMBFR80_21720 [Dehalococcoidia bacterium]
MGLVDIDFEAVRGAREETHVGANLRERGWGDMHDSIGIDRLKQPGGGLPAVRG